MCLHSWGKYILALFTALPLHNAAPERYFRDYAYAAAVSNIWTVSY